MAANGGRDYKTLAEFAEAATVGMAAVIYGVRTPAQFKEWLRWATIQRSGLEPETHRLLDMMAEAAETLTRQTANDANGAKDGKAEAKA